MKTPNKQTLIKCILLSVLLVTWLAMLLSLWEAWQSVKHLSKMDHAPMRLLNLDSQSYLSYMDMHQRYAPKNKAVIKTIHVCNQSMHQPSVSGSPLGCARQLKSRLI